MGSGASHPMQRRIDGSARQVAQRQKLSQMQGNMLPPDGQQQLAGAIPPANGEGVAEVPLDTLSEEEKHKHLADSFKKGQVKNPVVNAAGALVQRRPHKESYSNGDLFTVTKKDLDTGTDTSKATRKYVNEPNTPKPESISFDYATGKSGKVAKTTVTQRDDVIDDVDNPQADKAYDNGNYWDAGHKLGRQNGGLGNAKDWVFPQNPAINQGNNKNMNNEEKRHPLWRAHEDSFYEGVAESGGGAWWIRLN
ncbi:hypothetical protein [Dyella choica]|uniref:DNA/RNA non-specific endonuclease n=1 Tax=Dyella choica TaxID=1927959 RepID=A0A3S0PKX2_9GAMM|nr:hypothetical protein [Dyella choica]RUL79013.1 hypothetical protein EKH80_04230 [Dyella choica]